MSETQRPANRLAREASPYLRQHMHNPVDWYPWGPEALTKAKAEQKPIFLSVGYAACHWCHVMEKDAFEVESVAALLNQGFVSIKVDREERPDVDALYQGVVQLMGKGGGWPLTVFLTPDLDPFFGGTYFPPKPSYGLPGFSGLLEAIHKAWTERRDEVLQSATSFREGLGRYVQMGVGVGEERLRAADLFPVCDQLVDALDKENGGFFDAPKFPHPMELAFLLRMASSPPEGMSDERRLAAEHAVRFSLDEMARGGIYDQLGGGFHRYSVDAAWRVPHFEKMLYDNAQLVRLYAEAARAFDDESYARISREIAGWMKDELTNDEGGLYSSQDADTEGVEGKSFVWTPGELREVLGEELAAVAAAHFDVTEGGNFEGGASVLRRKTRDAPLFKAESAEEPDPRIEEARTRLLAARRRRVAPATDDKVIAAWNGLAIGGLAAAGRLLDEPTMVEQARRAADFVLGRLYRDGGLQRIWREGVVKQEAFLDDWAALSEGLIELFETTGERRYLETARALATKIVDEFWDPERGGFFLSSSLELGHRVPSVYDNAVPAGASSATVALLRLHALIGEDRFGEVSSNYLKRQRDELMRNPFAFGHLLCAAYLQVKGITEVAVLGEDGVERRDLLAAARQGLHPEILAYAAPAGEGDLLGGKGEVDGRPAAYICRRFACEAPLGSPQEVSGSLGI